jgi:hypothetical protein
VNKKISISKLLIAVLFLTAYCNVLVTQLSCNLSDLAEAAEQHDHHPDNDLAEHSHSHSHGHSHGDSHSDSQSHSQKHHDYKDDNCCKNKTAAFFAAQTSPVNPTFEFQNTCSADIAFSSSATVNFPLPFTSKDYFTSWDPPPKIPDIRVFIQSFQI